MDIKMNTKPLEGKKIGVIVESKFIPEEIQAYQDCFTMLGAEVKLLSRIYYGDYRPGNPYWKPPLFIADVDPSDQEPWQGPQTITVPDENDISNVNLDEYSAIIMTANYVSVRLRYPDDATISDPLELVRSAPVPRFFADAMKRPQLVKGALCHGLWILTPYRELLNKRRVTCHTVVMADILNAGADVVFEKTDGGRMQPSRVVVDRDLVTGFSKHEVIPFIQAITEKIIEKAG